MAGMPDHRQHRGPHPQDQRLFAEHQLGSLRRAVADLSWLLGQGYAAESAARLVGERYQLTTRQRAAVRRCACPDQSLEQRHNKETSLAHASGQAIAIDGFNLLITIETAFSGGVILVGRDGCHRDLSSVWGSYRIIRETGRSINAVCQILADAGITRVDCLLDRPVSNSGRLKALIGEQLPADNEWRIKLADSVDRILKAFPGPVVSSDAAILDRCSSWIDLAGTVITTAVPDAWTVDLGLPPE